MPRFGIGDGDLSLPDAVRGAETQHQERVTFFLSTLAAAVNLVALCSGAESLAAS